MSVPSPHQQAGASLIEVLVTMLIMSFGLLALAGMLAYSIQMPKLASYRATAVHIANSHIERIRANRVEFVATTTGYSVNLTYDESFAVPGLNNCNYPSCTSGTLAVMDNAQTQRLVRQELPGGGMMVSRDSLDNSQGNLWILWQEPSSFALLGSSSSDNCPAALNALTLTGPRPRCIYMRFKV